MTAHRMCSDCTLCPSYVQTMPKIPAVLRDGPCPECGHQLGLHEDGQARRIASALIPGATVSRGQPPAGSPLAKLLDRLG